MAERPSNRALVVSPRADIIDRLDRLSTPGKNWRRREGAVRPALAGGAYVVVTPDESSLAEAAALAWASTLKARNGASALVLDYAWERDGLSRMVKAHLEVGVRDIVAGAMMSDNRIISGQHCDFLPVGCAPKYPPTKKEIGKFRNLLELLKTIYTNVIVLVEDPLRMGESIEFGRVADGVIFAVGLNQSERARLEALKHRFEQRGVAMGGIISWRGDKSPEWLSKLSSR